MNNFESMPYGEALLREMYNVPAKELPTAKIVEILQNKLADKLGDKKLTELHVSQLYASIGLRLIERKKVAPKPPKPAKINPMDVLLNNLNKEPVTENPTIFPKEIVDEVAIDDLSDYDSEVYTNEDEIVIEGSFHNFVNEQV